MTDDTKVDKLLSEIERTSDDLLDLARRVLQADEGRLFTVDLLAIGAVKRVVTVASGFRLLVRDNNYLCAAPLLRMQLDSATRFMAAALVDDPHKFSLKVLEGKPIREMRDRSGKLMTDRYLVRQLTAMRPWVERVYKNTSGFVHLSEKHMLSPVMKVHDEDRIVQYLLHERDPHIPTEHWEELVGCFLEATRVFGGVLASWGKKKHDVGIERKRRQGED